MCDFYTSYFLEGSGGAGEASRVLKTAGPARAARIANIGGPICHQKKQQNLP